MITLTTLNLILTAWIIYKLYKAKFNLDFYLGMCNDFKEVFIVSMFWLSTVYSIITIIVLSIKYLP